MPEHSGVVGEWEYNAVYPYNGRLAPIVYL